MRWVLPPGSLERASSLRLFCWRHAVTGKLDQAELARRGISVCDARTPSSMRGWAHT